MRYILSIVPRPGSIEFDQKYQITRESLSPKERMKTAIKESAHHCEAFIFTPTFELLDGIASPISV